MTKQTEDEGGRKQPTSRKEKSAAQQNWDEMRGEELCYVAERIRKRPSSGLYIYELTYRVDLLAKDDPVLMVKGFDGESAWVAFIYSVGLLTGLSSLAGLLRSGKLKWRDDKYPSKKVRELLEG